MSFADLLPLSLLGAVIGLDVVSFPQAMWSRPIVASTLAGAFAGDAGNGMIIGVVLEMIALDTQPFGASRYPEWGTAAVVAGAICGSYQTMQPGLIVGALLAGLVTAAVGGWSMINIRQRNVRRVRLAHDAVEHGSRKAIVGVQLYSLRGDLVRGALVTFFMLFTFNTVVKEIITYWTVSAGLGRIGVLIVAVPVAAVAVRRALH